MHLFYKQPSIFPSEERPIGRTHLAEHTISLKEGVKPKYVPAYRVPHSKKVLIKDAVNNLETLVGRISTFFDKHNLL